MSGSAAMQSYGDGTTFYNTNAASSTTTTTATFGTGTAQCCVKDMTTANCGESTYTGSPSVKGSGARMAWGNDAPTIAPWQNNLPSVHADLIVAATN